MNQLKGKTAIISGGGTGIGKGIALALAAEGVNVLIFGRREAPLADVANKIENEGGVAHYLIADVSKEADVQRIIDTAVDQFGSVDIVVNNAGIGGGGPIHQHNVAAWDKIMDINLRGPFLMSRAALPIMRQAKSGHILNISSESGLEYYTGSGAYGVSKHALNALGEYIQRENQDFGIRVDTICPGMVISEMSAKMPGLNHEKCLTPEDIGELVVWLVSRRPNVKIGTPILMQTMENPWEN